MLSNTSVGRFGRFLELSTVQVCDGAVVAGFVVGHRYTLVNEEIVLELTPTTVGASREGGRTQVMFTAR